MKKKIIAALMAVVLIVCTATVSLAENDEVTGTDSIFEPVDVQNVTTGSQERAQSRQEDVDEDIRDDVLELIPDNMEEIRIGTADELIAFADNCRLDTWSANKVAVLTSDIDLLGKDFQGIPYFGGIFDGKGYTIKELNITNSLSYAGLFGYLQKGASIKNLKVEGSVVPSGNNIILGGIVGDNYGSIRECSFKGIVKGVDYVGGVAGINELSGEIAFSNSEGYISGTHFVGGICGENMGNVANCTNDSSVNTSINDTRITFDAMERLNTVINLIKNAKAGEDTASADVTISDVGGIAGLSIGIISRCINNGEVGYEHVGYNMGGIAGRQSGYLVNCSNNGTIRGRKDVGGIVGQAEPYITVDLSSDVAYQLSEAISQLHDTVSTTLSHAKAQSDTIAERLAVIKKFTAGAVDDTRYIATGAVDFINGAAVAANSTISRIDYVIDEASKQDGLMDETVSAASNMTDSISEIRDTVEDIDILQYLDEGELEDYYRARNALEIIASQEETLYDAAYYPYYNEFINQHGDSYAEDLWFRKSNGDYEQLNIDADAGADLDGEGNGVTVMGGEFVHYDEDDDTGEDFPISDGSDQEERDERLSNLARAYAATNAAAFVKEKYVSPEGYSGDDIKEDTAAATQTIAELTYRHLPDMTEATRSDAQDAVNSFEAASSDLTGALKSARDIAEGVSDQPDIVVPTLSDEYRAHTSSLADNMAAMNDNFGLLSNELNSTTGVLIDDLQDLSDQFNNILMLYTDAIDGVLEKDYTNIFNDTSLSDAEFTTDATVDNCLNFGICEGDIDTSGIAGTMAIEYDFDKESQITGITDGGLNTSFITKCVLRNNRNYGVVKGLKDYSGGVCGKQEMGTILGCGSYSNVVSTSGNYVGGITGASLSYILRSYAKGELDGMSYVGGIAGDGKNISDCLALVTVGDADSWYGAIAGHVSENGEVRGNYFVSDDLAGIDRVSYSLKAEPVSYDDVINNRVFAESNKASDDEEAKGQENSEGKVVALSAQDENSDKETAQTRSLPNEFGSLTVRFILEDDDLPGGSEEVGRVNKNYGESISVDEYPGVKNKEGFYVSWDRDEIDNLTTDATVTATYKRYRTTLSVDVPKDNVHMSDLLVDGMFREDDELKIVKTALNTSSEKSENDILLMEQLDITIPDDGSPSHRIRFRPQDDYYKIAGNFGKFTDAKMVLLQKTDKGIQSLNPIDTMGQYEVYDVEGNQPSLVYGYKGMSRISIIIVALTIAAIIIILGILVFNIVLILKSRKKARKVISDVREKVSARIDSKEQLFYDDSEDDKKRKEADKEPVKETESDDKEDVKTDKESIIEESTENDYASDQSDETEESNEDQKV